MKSISVPRNNGPLVSVVVPMRNEAQHACACLDSLAAVRYEPLEIIIVDDRSSDETSAVVEGWLRGHADARFRFVLAPGEPPQGWMGKTFATDFGITHSSGELLLIADADIRHAPDSLAESVLLLRGARASMLVRLPLVPLTNAGNVLSDFLLATIWVASRVARAVGGLPLSFGAYVLMERAFYAGVGGFAAQRSFPESLPLARIAAAEGRYLLRPPSAAVSALLYGTFVQGARGALRNINFSLVSPAARAGAFVFIGFPLWALVLAAYLPGWGITGLAAWCAAYVSYGRYCGRSWTAALALGCAGPLCALALALISCAALVRRAMGAEVSWRGRTIRMQ